MAHWILAYVTIQMNRRGGQLCRLLWNPCGFGYLYSNNGRSIRTTSWLCKDQFCRGWTETICGMVKSKASVVFVFIRHWKIWVYFFHFFCLYSICCLKIASNFFSFAWSTRIAKICAQLHIVKAYMADSAKSLSRYYFVFSTLVRDTTSRDPILLNA